MRNHQIKLFEEVFGNTKKNEVTHPNDIKNDPARS